MNLNKSKVELEHNRFDPTQWDYKKSPFQDGNKFITTVTFLLDQKTAKDQAKIQAECKKYTGKKWKKTTIKGYSQGDWQDVYYVEGEVSKEYIEEIENFFMFKTV